MQIEQSAIKKDNRPLKYDTVTCYWNCRLYVDARMLYEFFATLRREKFIKRETRKFYLSRCDFVLFGI